LCNDNAVDYAETHEGKPVVFVAIPASFTWNCTLTVASKSSVWTACCFYTRLEISVKK